MTETSIDGTPRVTGQAEPLHEEAVPSEPQPSEPQPSEPVPSERVPSERVHVEPRGDETPWDRAARALASWSAEAKALAADARALAPFAKPRTFSDLTKLPKLADGARAKLTAGGRGEALLEELLAEQQRRVETQKRELAKQLAEACGRRELELLVVRREEPVELRIPPFAVELDRAKGRATLQFARLPVAVCEAEAEPIAALVARWRDTWMRDFQPARFFDACRGAWAAARATGLGGQSERVEILEFMPFIALQLQPAKFRQEPSAKNFVDYSRAHFAFDLMQLRRAGLLNHEGWRLNLGVATGTTASNKKRALFVEDERGQGEYKLTVYFTRA